eukprot:7708842-Alexandrium_andersonii.AAC.1
MCIRDRCDLCGAAVAAGAPACPARVATLRMVRALGLSGRRLSRSQRDWVARSILIMSEMVEAQMQRFPHLPGVSCDLLGGLLTELSLVLRHHAPPVAIGPAQ